MRLDNDTILELCRLQDPVGVISIYVGTTPERQTGYQPQWVLAIRNQIRELRARVKEEGPRERWVAVHERLDGLNSELEGLLDPKLRGRGRALFIPVSSADVYSIVLQMPLPDTVVLEKRAFVRPLVVAMDEGRAAGVVFVDRSGLRLLEWRFGEVEEISEHPFVDESSEWREMKGPAQTNPALDQQASVQRDTFEDRLDEHRAKFVKQVAVEVQKEVSARSWDRLVVAGEARLAQPFADVVRVNGLEILRTDHDLRHAGSHEVDEAVAPLLTESQRRLELSLVERAKELGLSGRQGALGLSDTLGALGEGRVQHLLYDDSRDFTGFHTSDGRLFHDADGNAPSRAELEPEPHLTERMIERTLETGGRVTPVEGPAAEALEPHGGVAAILRW